MTDYAAPNLVARNVAAVLAIAAIQLFALALLGALLLSAPAKAEEPVPPPPPAETVAGTCQHPDESVMRWLRLIGFSGIASNGCQSAVLDWSARITFHGNKEASKPAIAFIGRRGPNGDFEVTAVEARFMPETPASGRCQVIAPETEAEEGSANLGARRVLCFARQANSDGLVHVTEMIIAERDWPGTAAIPGRCSAPGIAQYVLGPMIAEQTGAEPALLLQALPACLTMTVAPGKSYAFASTGSEGEVTFLGTPDEEHPLLLRVNTIILPGGTQHSPLAGACLPKREADGHVTVLCMAAFADGGATKFVEVGFIPEASRFEWPPETLEPEPLP